MNIEVLSIDGQTTGRTVVLDDSKFGIEPNEHAVYLSVKHYLAAQRQGTHKAKERGELAFSTKKIKRQKGTGTARAGSIRNPLFRKGGRIFGPRPRDYSFKLNRKVKKLARYSALSDKAREGSIIVLENIDLSAPKTADLRNIMNRLNVLSSKVLLVSGESDRNLLLSGRNIPTLNMSSATDINTYDVLNADRVIFLENAVDKLV